MRGSKEDAMTEAEWLESTNPDAMLRHIWNRTSARKLRLFACAWVRSRWDLFPDPRSRAAVITGERYADGFVAEDERQQVREAAFRVGAEMRAAGEMLKAYETLYAQKCVEEELWCVIAIDLYGPDTGQLNYPPECVYLLSEIFGNPFRPVDFDPCGLTSAAHSLAQYIYEERCFQETPILADALEEGGLANPEILEHFRQNGEHFLGCWALDLVLGKS
jgi:hypothetical protein